MSWMFSFCCSLSSLDLSNFNTQNVKYMDTMFYGCSSLLSLDLSNFNTQNVEHMDSMFYGCSSLSYLDISSFIVKYEISIFDIFPNECQIKMNNKSMNLLKNLPISCNITIIDG